MNSSRDEVLLEAEFDRRVMGYGRLAVCLLLLITLVGVPLIPFWLIWSVSYLPKAYDRFSARLTPISLELTRGVYFRSDSTIPLDRITDVRLHDDPLMRFSGIQGLKVETAGQSGTTGAEGNLIGVVDAPAFRDAILRQTRDPAGERADGVAVGRRKRPGSASGDPRPAEEHRLEDVGSCEDC